VTDGKPTRAKQESVGTSNPAKASDWRIAAGQRGCVRCHAPFLEGKEYYSLLRLDRESSWGFVREDLCGACWKREKATLDADGEARLIFWKTRRKSSKEDRHHVDLASLRQLFIGLLEDPRPEIEALRYVVGLMLSRKKLIRVIRAHGGAKGDLVFRDPREGKEDARVRLPIPELSEESLDALREQLSDIVA